MAMAGESMAVGAFRDYETAEQAVQDLHDAGFKNDQINLLGHSSGKVLDGIKHFFSNKKDVVDTNMDLASSGIAQEDMSYYQRELENGNFIVTVIPRGHLQEAQNILNRSGAYSAPSNAKTTNSMADGSGEASTLPGGNMTTTGNNIDSTATSAQVIPLREERLHIDKQVIQSGEVIIRKRVITENKTFTIPVRREEVSIERLSSIDSAKNESTSMSNEENAGNSIVSDETIANMIDGGEMLRRDGNIRILVREEQITFDKKTVVVEEIVVSKKQVQEIKPFTDTIRREEVRVEHTGNVIIHDDDVNKNR